MDVANDVNSDIDNDVNRTSITLTSDATSDDVVVANCGGVATRHLITHQLPTVAMMRRDVQQCNSRQLWWRCDMKGQLWRLLRCEFCNDGEPQCDGQRAALQLATLQLTEFFFFLRQIAPNSKNLRGEGLYTREKEKETKIEENNKSAHLFIYFRICHSTIWSRFSQLLHFWFYWLPEM